MRKFYSDQIKDIKSDIGRIANKISERLATQAHIDLVKSFDFIIDDFYKSYTPSSYHRKGDLYRMLKSDNVSHSSTPRRNVATITVSGDGMSPFRPSYKWKNPSQTVVFNLMWNQGVRGLPAFGKKELDNSYVFVKKIKKDVPYVYSQDDVIDSANEGDRWVNNYYKEFKTKIQIGMYTTITDTPDNVMCNIVNNWDCVNGLRMCEEINENTFN